MAPSIFQKFASTLWPAPGFADTELGVLMELEVAHGVLKKPRPTSRRNRREVVLHCEAPGDLGRGLDVRGGLALCG
jgi:hypothetical protein